MDQCDWCEADADQHVTQPDIGALFGGLDVKLCNGCLNDPETVELWDKLSLKYTLTPLKKKE
tara:strand:+ start:1019 stop:1204 length:186 start_codon:yes stop_codon:yes gene_type:complete